MAEIHVHTKKIFTFVTRRLARALARRERARRVVFARLAKFVSQFKSRKNPYFMRTSEIVCLLTREMA
jgi:hypothetical protein